MRGKALDLLGLALALAGVLSAAWVATGVFDRLPHLEDEIANLWQAEVFADGQLYVPSPPLPTSFTVAFVMDYQGRRFGKYAPGWPAALSLGARMDAPWAVSPLLGGLALWLIYRLGTKVAGRGIGLVAEALALTSPMFLMLSGTLMSHAFSLFLAAAFSLAWLDLFLADGPSGQQNLPPWLLVAVSGTTLGLLALTRPLTALGIGIPFIIHGLVLLARGDTRARWPLACVAGLAGTVAALIPLWQWAVTGDPWLNPYTLWWPYDKLGFGPGIGNTPTGHTLSLAYWNARFSLRAGVHDLFGWPWLSWILLPFGLIGLRRDPRGWLTISVFPSLVLIHTAYWIGSWLFGPRYYYEALPGVCITSAAGLAWLGSWFQEEARGWIRLRRLATLAIVTTLVALNVLFYLPTRLGSMRGLNGVFRTNLRPLQSLSMTKTLVIVHPDKGWYDYGTLLALTPPFSEGELLLAYSRGPQQDSRLALAMPEWPVYHYYPDDPDWLYASPRDE